MMRQREGCVVGSRGGGEGVDEGVVEGVYSDLTPSLHTLQQHEGRASSLRLTACAAPITFCLCDLAPMDPHRVRPRRLARSSAKRGSHTEPQHAHRQTRQTRSVAVAVAAKAVQGIGLFPQASAIAPPNFVLLAVQTPLTQVAGEAWRSHIRVSAACC